MSPLSSLLNCPTAALQPLVLALSFPSNHVLLRTLWFQWENCKYLLHRQILPPLNKCFLALGLAYSDTAESVHSTLPYSGKLPKSIEYTPKTMSVVFFKSIG